MTEINLRNVTPAIMNKVYKDSEYFGYSEIIKYCTNIKKVLFANLLYLCGHSIWFFYYLNFHLKADDLEMLFTLNKKGLLQGNYLMKTREIIYSIKMRKSIRMTFIK